MTHVTPAAERDASGGTAARVRVTARLIGSVVLPGFLLLADAPASAQDGGIAVHGWGKADCKRFLAVRRAGGSLEQSLRQWVFGFVSAYNILVAPSGDALGGADPPAIIGMVDRACAQDPSLRVSGAVNSVLGGE